MMRSTSTGQNIRKSVIAGTWYPGRVADLTGMIDDFLSAVPETRLPGRLVGLISPHAGYPYSGLVAADTLSRVAFREAFVILGPNHTGRGVPFSIMAEGAWHTPLGPVRIDSELASCILAESDLLEEDAAAHQYEHSIEVQLPFLQYFKKDVQFVPIVLGQRMHPFTSESVRASRRNPCLGSRSHRDGEQ